jgi:hypothetical protein
MTGLHKTLVGRMYDDTRVYTVDGTTVRDTVDTDYTEGGHDLVYPGAIPKGEIWVEAGDPELDMLCAAAHEMFERHLMDHEKMSYDRAHDHALAFEQVLRTIATGHPAPSAVTQSESQSTSIKQTRAARVEAKMKG